MFGPAALRRAAGEDILKLGPILRALPKRIDRIAASMERDEPGVNVRLLAAERDARFLTRLVDRAIVAFISAAIALTSAVLITVSARLWNSVTDRVVVAVHDTRNDEAFELLVAI